MNFLFIVNTFYPNIGGVERATFDLCKQLVRQGHQVSVLTLKRSNFYSEGGEGKESLKNYEEIAGINIYRVSEGFRIYLMFLKALYLAIKRKINYIYVTDFWGIIALILKRIFHIPFVYVLNGYNPICPKGTLYHTRQCEGFAFQKCLKKCKQFSIRFLLAFLITKLLLRENAPIIAVSNVVREVFSKYFGNLNIKTLYYGVDMEKFRPTVFKQGPLLPYQEIIEGSILFLGRLIKIKGIGTFLRQYQRAFQHQPEKLVIVGYGPQYNELKMEVQRLQLQRQVLFTGFLRGQKLVKVIQAAKVVIMPLLFPEPLGLVVLEAMACAKPVVSFAIGGVRELIEHKKTGYLIPPNDWKEFMNTLTKLLNNEALCRQLGAAARRKVEQFYSWDKFIDNFLKLIREMS
ncbi:MAG: glycosyltransferase family 4 protein [Candidatus Helarchaeota archaeon]